jgi:hypothetical protein
MRGIRIIPEFDNPSHFLQFGGKTSCHQSPEIPGIFVGGLQLLPGSSPEQNIKVVS